jgi:hypothetical protein
MPIVRFMKRRSGDFNTEFQGESGAKGLFSGYGAAAGKIVDQVDAWVKTNHDKLAELKK